MANIFQSEIFLTIIPYVIIAALLYFIWMFFLNMLKNLGKGILGGIKKVGGKFKKGKKGGSDEDGDGGGDGGGDEDGDEDGDGGGGGGGGGKKGGKKGGNKGRKKGGKSSFSENTGYNGYGYN